MKFRKNIILIIAALFITVGLLAFSDINSSAAAKEVTNCNKWHTVLKGESLRSIAKKYDLNWRYLVEINDLMKSEGITPGQKLCVSVASKSVTKPQPVSGTLSKNIYATSVKEDLNVTLVGKNLVPSNRYSIYLSNFKSKFPVSFLVGTITTDKDGAFKGTYNLPKKLYDVVKIRVTITNNKGDSLANWFFNATYEGNTGGIGAPTLSFVFESVKKNDSVKIKISNLPANTTFEVRMGKAGSQGENGILVGTINDPKGGSKVFTFEIPDELQGKSKLDLRIEQKTLGIVVYQTFENK